jgi:hypothetical protein
MKRHLMRSAQSLIVGCQWEQGKAGGNEVGLEGAFHREKLDRVIDITHADLG